MTTTTTNNDDDTDENDDKIRKTKLNTKHQMQLMYSLRFHFIRTLMLIGFV